MDCQYGCGRKSVLKLDSCIPCYKLIHGERTAHNIMQWIKSKEYSQNESIFKIERFLLERSLIYLKNRLQHILEGMCTENCWRYSRMFLRRFKQVPEHLLISLNRFYQANPHDDEEFLESLDNELLFRIARRYGRSSSDEEESMPVSNGNNENNFAASSGTPEKRKHSNDRVFSSAEIPNEDKEEQLEPPKKRKAQIKRQPTGNKRSCSSHSLDDEDKESVQASKRSAGETNKMIADDSSVINIENSLQYSDHEDLTQKTAQPLKQHFRRKKRSELELLKVGLPPYFQIKIESPPVSQASSLPITPQAVAPVRKPSGTAQIEKRGRPRKQPLNRLRDNLGRFVRDDNKVRQPPRPKIRRRRTELELLKAGLPLFYQS